MVALHRAGYSHHGIDLHGRVSDMLSAGVVEPLRLKQLVMTHATEMATSLIKIDGSPVFVRQPQAGS